MHVINSFLAAKNNNNKIQFYIYIYTLNIRYYAMRYGNSAPVNAVESYIVVYMFGLCSERFRVHLFLQITMK